MTSREKYNISFLQDESVTMLKLMTWCSLLRISRRSVLRAAGGQRQCWPRGGCPQTRRWRSGTPWTKRWQPVRISPARPDLRFGFRVEDITGISGVKSRVQVTFLGFRPKSTSQIDGGVQIKSNWKFMGLNWEFF